MGLEELVGLTLRKSQFSFDLRVYNTIGKCFSKFQYRYGSAFFVSDIVIKPDELFGWTKDIKALYFHSSGMV